MNPSFLSRRLPRLLPFMFLLVWSTLSLRAQDAPSGIPATPIMREEESKPLPDLESLMVAVQKHQERDESVERNYIYRSATVVEFGEKDEKPKHALSTVDEVYWYEGVRVVRSLERDGKPLTTEQQAKESERINRRIASRRDKVRAKRDDVEIPLSRLLELGVFTSPRREMVNGRSTIAVAFTGNPKAKTHNDNEKIIHQVAGTVWLDEADLTVQHLEGRLLENFHVGGGMVANIGKGTTFSMSKRRVNDEIWLTESLEMRGHFRLLLLFATDTHMRMQNSDFRKFKATSRVLPGITPVGDTTLKPDKDKIEEPH